MAMPLNLGRTWFNIIAFFFGCLSIVSIVGMVTFMWFSSFYPPEKQYDAYEDKWNPTGEAYFSYLVLAGVIMLSIYAVPMIMRPIDFICSPISYIVGLFTYMLMIPVFINVFTIYAFSNLHDISWGNRPTTSDTGQEAMTANLKTQEENAKNYKEFRANVLFFWIASNAAYFYIILKLSSGSDDPTKVNDGSFGPLQGFTMFLAGIVVFRVFFAILYVLKWKFRYCCKSAYRVKKKSLKDSYNNIMKAWKKGEVQSSDDEETFKKAR